MARRKIKIPQGEFDAEIVRLDSEGRGLAYVNEHPVFIYGALAGESVKFKYIQYSSRVKEGVATEVLSASDDRVQPFCGSYGYCGGCSLQHLAPEKQVEFKQQGLLDQFKHLAKLEPEALIPPLLANTEGYRRKARLGIKFVKPKDKVLVGFRERQGRYLADIPECEVLHPAIGQELGALQALFYGFSIRDQVPQMEVAVADNGVSVVLRHLQALSKEDLEAMKAFCAERDWQLYLQPKGMDSIHLASAAPGSKKMAEPALYYAHPDYGVQVNIRPQDFFQVNFPINRAMVAQAIELLALDGSERVLDLFCGLGNFTLPLAKVVQKVVAVEGSLEMIQQAKAMAVAQGVNNTEYFVADLMDVKALDDKPAWLRQTYDCVILDPPRSGAKEIIPYLKALGAERIVYVSCNPATLARDAEVLVALGYRLAKAGVMDMFPHTSHVESMALFVKGK